MCYAITFVIKSLFLIQNYCTGLSVSEMTVLKFETNISYVIYVNNNYG